MGALETLIRAELAHGQPVSVREIEARLRAAGHLRPDQSVGQNTEAQLMAM